MYTSIYFGYISRSEMPVSSGRFIFNLKETAELFSKVFSDVPKKQHFTFTPAVYESSSCSVLLLTLYMVSLFNFSHFDEWVVVFV